MSAYSTIDKIMLCSLAGLVITLFIVYLHLSKAWDEKEALGERIIELEAEIKEWERAEVLYECGTDCQSLRRGMDICCKRAQAFEEQALQCINEKLSPKENK